MKKVTMNQSHKIRFSKRIKKRISLQWIQSRTEPKMKKFRTKITEIKKFRTKITEMILKRMKGHKIKFNQYLTTSLSLRKLRRIQSLHKTASQPPPLITINNNHKMFQTNSN